MQKNSVSIPFYETALSVLFISFVAMNSFGSDFQFQGPFGIAVRDDGSFYVAEIQGKRISKFDKYGEPAGEIKYIEGYGYLKGPFDVDFGRSGNVYITDTLGHSVLVLDKNEKLILRLGTGVPSADMGSLHEPHFSVADEQHKRIFVSDTHNHRIQVFDTAGRPLKVTGHSGRQGKPGTYDFASGITIDGNGGVYAMSLYGGIINVYDNKYQLVRAIGSRGYRPGQFNAAYGITYHDGAIWVADTRNSRLQKISTDGDVLSVIDNGEGSGPNQLNNPTDIEFDTKGDMFVADWKNSRVVKYDPKGNPVRTWGKEQVEHYTPPREKSPLSCRKPVDVAVYGGIDKKNVDAAARALVKWIYVSIGYDDQQGKINPADKEWDIKEMVDYAHEKGIKVSAYISVYQMGVGLSQWQAKPEFYMWKKGAKGPSDQALSYYYPQVRAWKVKHITEQVRNSGVDGLLLDYIRYPNNLMGYEPVMVQAFTEETGKDINSVMPDDIDWLEFRARYITLFVSELRKGLKQLDKPVVLSAYVGPDWQDDLKTVVRNWRDWIDAGLIDMVCLGEYSRDFKSFYESVREAQRTCGGRAKVSIVIACWGGNLYNSDLLMEGAKAALAAEPDEIAIYRGDAINKLNLWDAIRDISLYCESPPVKAADSSRQ